MLQQCVQVLMIKHDYRIGNDENLISVNEHRQRNMIPIKKNTNIKTKLQKNDFVVRKRRAHASNRFIVACCESQKGTTW